MTDTTTMLALLKIWDELPTLANAQWTVLEPRLRQLLEAYHSTNDKQAREQISLDIQRSLETIPAVIDRFDDAFAELSDSDTRGTRGGSQPFSGFFGSVRLTPRSHMVTRYTDITYPRRTWLGNPRIQVVVRLTRQPFDPGIRQEEFFVNSRQPVTVYIEAPGFELLNDAVQQVSLPSDADSPPLVFDLRPARVGHTTIVLDFFQAGNHIGTVSLSVETTAQQLDPENNGRVTQALPTGENVARPDVTLVISHEQHNGSSSLSFRLSTDTIVEQDFEPVPLRLEPEIYTKHLYGRITSLVNSSDPTIETMFAQTYELLSPDLEGQIKQVGQNLWKELIPPGLKQFYEQHREQWRDRSLLILSDEPYIPWELLWPYGVWGDDGPLCLLMLVSRWLRRSRQGEATKSMEPALQLRSLVVIAPDDADLPAAQREQTFLLNLVQQRHLLNASPTEPTRPHVNHLLQKKTYDWFHVASHGSFHPQDPDGTSAIWLKDHLPLTVEAIVGEVEISIGKQRPAFFFNACETGRQGWSLTGIGGWADRLINAGASLFLAPQWNVKDGTSLLFCKEVYRSLLEGKTIAEAVRKGRLTARREGDPTWLAYSLYAHPNARLTIFSQQPGS
jgi:hypothetical protein